jgi:hypothetical protein
MCPLTKMWDAGLVLHVCKDAEKMVSHKREEVAAQLVNMAREWKLRGARPPRLGWCQRVPGDEVPDADPRGRRVNANSVAVMVANSSSLIVVISPEVENFVSLGLNLNGVVLLDNSVFL